MRSGGERDIEQGGIEGVRKDVSINQKKKGKAGVYRAES